MPVPADPQAMAAIASGSGGKSFTAKNGNELNSVYDQIRKVVGYDTVPTDLTEWFVGLALLLAVLTAGAALVLDAAHPVDRARLGNAERSRTTVHARVRRAHDRGLASNRPRRTRTRCCRCSSITARGSCTAVGVPRART